MEMPPAKIKSFEDLYVFQEALRLANEIYRITRQGAFARDYGLADQIRRSAVSILSNIAEGFERETTSEFIRSLYVAKGSCGELRAQLMVAREQKFITEGEHSGLSTSCRKISAGLYQMITRLRKRTR
jgi:four helix bundle protein